LSEKWAVGAMGCRNNGPSEQWAVGIMGCRNNDLTPYTVPLAKTICNKMNVHVRRLYL
jgi:hypothetical protein